LETVRQYARERLADSREGEHRRDRHVAHFVALGEEAEPPLTGADQRHWLERLEAEHDNVRAALNFILDSQHSTLDRTRAAPCGSERRPGRAACILGRSGGRTSRSEERPLH
jgi:predicted ATPase